MKGTFAENRPFIEHEYQNPHWIENSGMPVKKLQIALREYVDCNLSLPMPILRAKAFAFLLENVQIEINPHSLFCDKLNLGIDYSDYAGQDLFAMELYHRFHKEVLEREIPEVFKKRNVAEQTGVCFADADFWHTLPEWTNVLKYGIRGLLDRAKKAKQDKILCGKLNEQQAVFYDSVIISYEAMLKYVIRLLDASRAYDVLEYTACLEDILSGPPLNFYEAIEMSLLYMNMEEIGVERARSLGRFDQLYIDFYRTDIQNGTFTIEQIKDILRYFYIRLQAARRFADQPFSICGVDEYGRDATNELSWLLLDVYDGMKIYNPKIHVCCSKETPKSIILRVLDLIRRGSSSFVLINNEAVIRGYERIGIGREESQLYVPFGCYEPILMGKEDPMIGASWLNMAKAIELAMNGGADMLTGETLFSQMPTEFDSYEAFEQAFYSILGDIIEFTKGTILQQNAYHMQINPSPVYSGSLSSCVEKGRDIFDGGTKYHNTSIKCCGIATVVDSLLMVKEYVFERKLLSFAELRRILLADWVGHEELRCIIRQNRMKYGNHLRQADELSHDIYKYAASKIVGQPNHSGGVFRMGTDSITNCVVFGGRMGATPDGRKQGDPISKNFCATNGMDRNGVTALFQSVTEMDTDDFVNGAVTDFILHPSAVQGERGLHAMYYLIETYFENGGYSVQGNVMNIEELIDAKEHPDKYPTLQVRVCGWNEYFIELSPEMQDMFIAQMQEAE